jgi:uncharacterized membrane protein YgaE (UPF0421/DUF939 family)
VTRTEPTTLPRPPAATRGMLASRPRVAMSVKTALAAAIAWAVVQPMPGVADTYPYYAPLGAVVAISTTVVGSFRQSAQSLLAILLGAGVAFVVDLVLATSVATLALVVAAGTLLAGWRAVGAMASWVPVSALFVLILGQNAPGRYVLAYAGLTALGTLIGIGVNLLFPSLPLTPAQLTLRQLRATLADQLEDLAEGLLREEPLTGEEWLDRRRDLQPLVDQARDLVQQATEGRRGNWRARRWQVQADRQYEEARTLEHLAFLVEEVTAIVVHHEAEGDHVAPGTPVLPRTAHALQAIAEVLRSLDGRGADTELFENAREALEALVEEIRVTRAGTGEDLFAVGGIVVTLRRALRSLEKRTEEEDTLP